MFSNICPTPEAVAAGLMEPDDGGEPRLTEAGLFALAAQLAYAEEMDAETRNNCMAKMLRVLVAAKAGGLPPFIEHAILWSFAEGYRPADGTEEGEILAKLCRAVPTFIGPGRIIQIFENQQYH